MRYLVVTFLLVFSISANAKDLVIKGRLLNIEKGVPECGVLKTGTMTEYRVMKIFSGNYSANRIFVVHPCIENQKPRLKIGSIYKLSLTPDNVQKIELYSSREITNKSNIYYLKHLEYVGSK